MRVDDWPTVGEPSDEVIKRLKGRPGTTVKLYVWRRGMEALADCANVACKISGLPVLGAPFTLEANKPIILDTISMFGVERCMFASNFPVDGLKGSWDYIYTTYKRAVADLDQRDQEKLFAENALKFYRIDLPV